MAGLHLGPSRDSSKKTPGWRYHSFIGTEDGEVRTISAEQWFRETTIWLPSQDQVQEMISVTEHQHAYAVFHNFHKFWTDETAGYHTLDFDTIEQLWLAFVMYKRFGKVWDDGQGWVHGNSKRITVRTFAEPLSA